MTTLRPSPLRPSISRCFVTTKSGSLRDDACGEGRTGADGTLHVDAAYGYTMSVDDGAGLGLAGVEVR